MSITSLILSLLHQYQYALLLPLSIIEGPIVTVLAGFLITEGFMNVYAVFALVVVADLIADIFWYVLGRWGFSYYRGYGTAWLAKHQKNFDRISHLMHHKFGTVIFIGKFTQVFSSLIELAAGIAKVPFSKFIFYNFINTLLKSGMYLLIGIFFGNAYQQIDQYIGYSTKIFLGLGLAALILYGLTLLHAKGKEFLT